MKKTIIGGILVLSGILTVSSIIIAAALYVPTINRWSGSKLWYAIFGAKQYGSEPVQSLFLGFPFVIGLILVVTGLIILGKEYLNNEK